MAAACFGTGTRRKSRGVDKLHAAVDRADHGVKQAAEAEKGGRKRKALPPPS